MNYTILFALMVQSAIAQASRTSGAIVGFLITTGILLWGLDAYSVGGAIAFFGIPLSKPVFIGACVLWYLFDAKGLFQAAVPEATGTILNTVIN